MDLIKRILATEPLLFARVITSVAAVAVAFGLPITDADVDGAVQSVASAMAFANILLAFIERRTVFSPATTQKIADRAADTGNTDIGQPPKGRV